MSIEVDPDLLSVPAERFRRAGADFTTISAVLGGIVRPAADAAGSPEVGAGCDTFQTGVTAVLGALGEETQLLGAKVARAGVVYRTVDETAVGAPDLTPGGAPR
jgi:hypothetical protein